MKIGKERPYKITRVRPISEAHNNPQRTYDVYSNRNKTEATSKKPSDISKHFICLA